MPRYAIVKFLDEESDNTPTWSQFAREYGDSRFPNLKPRTVRCLLKPTINNFSRFIKDRRIGSITRKDAFAFAQWLRDDLKFAESTIRTRLLTVGVILQEAVKANHIPYNPFHRLELPKAQKCGRVLTDDEIKLLLSALWDAPRRAAILSLYTGMRRGEVCSLDWSQVQKDARGAWIYIPPEKAKSGKERVIMLQQKALDALGRRGEGSVFGMSETILNNAVTHAWRLTGLGRVKFHDLRHTWVSRFAEKTDDIYALCDQAGWSDVRSAMPYMRVSRLRRERGLAINYAIWDDAPTA